MNKFKLSLLLLLLVTFSIFSQEKKYTTYQVQKGETLESITRKLAITPHDLLQLNPDIKEGVAENQLLIIPNKNYNPALDTKIGDYIKDGFLFHKVLPKENYWRLKQQFKVPKRILRKHNLALRTDDLKAGQIIKIPIKKGYRIETTVIQDDITKPYLVRPKETKYSISRRYGISIERLEELNPEIKEGLKLAQIIKVPDTREIPNIEEGFVIHQVEKGETIFSLSQIFKMSQEQLIEINPELSAGLKEGMLIKIPTAITAENKSIFTPNIPVDKHLKVAILLPFSTNKGNLDFEKDRTLNIATDFYLGALEALNLLKKQGLSVTAHVYDTENKKSTISNIIRTRSFEDVDAVIGPMFMDNVEFVTNSFKHDSLAIISPVSSKDHSMFASKNLIKEMPSEERLSDAMILYLQKNYIDQQLVLIADSISTPKYEFRLKGITKKLNELDSLHEVIVLRPENGYIKPDLFKESILEDKGNWIVLFTDEEVLISDAVNNLGVFSKEFDITLFCLNYGKNFDRVDNNFLARVNFHYPTASFIDFEDIEVQRFINRFKVNNYVEPSEYAFKGFDMTYDALLRLATYSDVGSAFDGGISERMSCKFHYTKIPNKGFENNGVFLVKYDGLNLVNVEKEPELINE
jgi:LysM repeat protein